MASNKILPIKVMNECFPATVSDAVKIPGSKENIKEYTDREIQELKNYCDSELKSDIINYLASTRTINVVSDLGLIPNNYSEEVRISNAAKLKTKILENENTFAGSIVFLFPEGEYHINPIEIDATEDLLGNNESLRKLKLFVTLIGESHESDYYSSKTNQSYATSRIITYGNFIIRTNNTPTIGDDKDDSAITIIAQDLYINQNDVNTINHENAPHGICFGSTYNSGAEHNFYIKRCQIVGFDKGIYSPGYSCGGTRFEEVTFALCKYGVLIMAASHCLTIERSSFNACYRGLSILFGGNYCEVKNVHVDSSFHPSFQQFLNEDPRCYFLYTTGGLTLDGLYMEQYTGVKDGYMETPETYYLIDYEGNNYAANGGKLIVKNVPCGSPGGYSKWFKGATFQGTGTLVIDGTPINETPLRQLCSNPALWKRGCVDFINCGPTHDSLKKYVNIYEGIDRASGYVFDYRDLYMDGLAFTKHPRRGFKGSFIFDYANGMGSIGQDPVHEKTSKKVGYGYMFYEKMNIDQKVKYYKGTRLFNETETGTLIESSGGYGSKLQGNITVDKITNENVNVTLFMYINGNDGNSWKRIDLLDINSSCLNKEISVTFNIEFNSLDYNGFYFGYQVHYNESLVDSERTNDIKAKMLTKEDESKITYEYVNIWDDDDVYLFREVDGISLSSETLNMTVGGGTQTLEVTYKPTYTTQKGVDWTTSNDQVATVVNGVVTAVGTGECDITATCNNNDYAHSAICKVTVGEGSV